MVDCPDSNCREDLLCRMNQRVKSSTLYLSLVLVITILLGIGTWIQTSYSDGQDKQQEAIERNAEGQRKCQDAISGVRTDIEVIKNKIIEVERKANKGETIQTEMLRILNKLESRSDGDND